MDNNNNSPLSKRQRTFEEPENDINTNDIIDIDAVKVTLEQFFKNENVQTINDEAKIDVRNIIGHLDKHTLRSGRRSGQRGGSKTSKVIAYILAFSLYISFVYGVHLSFEEFFQPQYYELLQAISSSVQRQIRGTIRVATGAIETGNINLIPTVFNALTSVCTSVGANTILNISGRASNLNQEVITQLDNFVEMCLGSMNELGATRTRAQIADIVESHLNELNLNELDLNELKAEVAEAAQLTSSTLGGGRKSRKSTFRKSTFRKSTFRKSGAKRRRNKSRSTLKKWKKRR